MRRRELLQTAALGVVTLGASSGIRTRPQWPVAPCVVPCRVTERDCSEWLAWELWRSGESALHASDLPLSIARYLGLLECKGQLAAQLSRISPEGQILCDQDGYCTLSHAGLIDFHIARRIFSSVSTGQSQLLATAQTGHATDLIIQQFVQRHELSAKHLSGWMNGSANPVLRVNSAGILAKLGRLDLADSVVKTLHTDQDNRQLYLTAVASRVLAMEWQQAAQFVARIEIGAAADLALTAAEAAELSGELTNPRDSAARWCSVVLLGSSLSAMSNGARPVLYQALRNEPCRENLRTIGKVLAGGRPLGG